MSRGGVLHVRLMSRSDYVIQFAALLSVTQIRSMFKFIEFIKTGCLHLLIPFFYFTHSLFPKSGNHWFLCICEPVSVLFIHFLILHISDNVRYLSLTCFTTIQPSRSIHVVTSSKISFFFMLRNQKWNLLIKIGRAHV